VKDLQSKLDAATAECLTEKEKVIDHFFFFETVTIIQLLVSHIYITTPCLMNLVEQEANRGEREAPVPHDPSYPCNKRGRIKIEGA
jgi:hypothetical protein